MTLKLNGSSSGYTAIDAPAAAGSNTLTLPTGNGNNKEVLQTNGSGALTWAKPGTIIQVVQNLITDTHSEALATTHWATLGSFSNTSITPSSASNKILISGWMSVGISSAMNVYLRLRRGSTVIGEADSAGSRRQGLSAGAPNDTNKIDSIPFFYIDSPNTTSATTYSVQLAHPSSSTRTIYINRDDTDTDAATGCRVCSSIVLQEIAA
jgi:hypothetical protein